MKPPAGDKPLWISHRGLGGRATENTRAAFEAAYARGFRALETDVRVTADDQLVLWHDADMRRLTGSARSVSSMRRGELEHMRFADGSEPYFLEQLLSGFPDCRITLDVKPEGAARAIPLAAGMLKSVWPACAARFRFLLWSRHDERRLRELLPAAECYARKWECWRAAAAVLSGAPALGAIARGRTYSLRGCIAGTPCCRAEIVRRYHQRGAKVLAFLPRSGAELEAALAAGVDEILTDGTCGTENGDAG